jgi:osmotically inducible protein OsmC
MPPAESTATTTWEGDLAHGSGTVQAASGVLADLPVSWASRTERSAGKTSPEELIAAAHSSCFSMALSHALAQAGHPPERLEVSATVVFDQVEGGFGITTSRLRVRGRVPGIDADAFAEAARGASEGCPVSAALRGNVDIQLDAALES